MPRLRGAGFASQTRFGWRQTFEMRVRFFIGVAALLAVGALRAQHVVVDSQELVVWIDSIPDYQTLEVFGRLEIRPANSDARGTLPGPITVRAGGSLHVAHVRLPEQLPSTSPALLAEPGSRVSVDDIFGTRTGAGVDSGIAVAPLLDLRCDSAAVRRSRFWGIGPLLTVRGSGSRIEECGFTVGVGTALGLAPEGAARDLSVRTSDFTVEAGPDDPAIGLRAGSPFVLIEDCAFFVLEEGLGLSVNPTAGSSADLPVESPSRTEGDYGLRGLTFRQEGGPLGRALEVVDTTSQRGLALRGISVEGFAEGMHLSGAGVTLVDARLSGNRLGLRHAGGDVRRVEVAGPGEVGIQLESVPMGDPQRRDLTDLHLSDLSKGLTVAGPIGSSTFVDSVTMAGVRERVAFGVGGGPHEILYAGERLTTTAWAAEAEVGGHPTPRDTSGSDARQGPLSRAAYAYVHPASDLVTEACRPADELRDCVECPSASIGTFAIATGRGATLPLFEHGRGLGAVYLVGARDSASRPATPYGPQGARTHLAAGRAYTLEVEDIDRVADILLTWRASRPLRLSLTYPHAQPVALHARGRLLPRVDSAAALAGAASSTYFVDRARGRVELMLVPDGGVAEVLVFPREVELPLRGTRGPITLRQLGGARPGQYAAAVGNALARVTVTDLAGEPLGRTVQVGAGGTPFVLTHYEGAGGWVEVEYGRERCRVPLLLPAYAPPTPAGEGP